MNPPVDFFFMMFCAGLLLAIFGFARYMLGFDFQLIIISVFIILFASLGIIWTAPPDFNMFEAIQDAPDQDTEYQMFLEYSNKCPCTIENTSYCTNASKCIHAYMYCQREQCPECFGGV